MSRLETVKKIVVHCSDSDFGDAAEIDRWHKERGWNGIGYHKVILNGHRQSVRPYAAADDGVVEDGRPLDAMGAHVLGHNSESIGICLIGRRHFTGVQLFQALPNLLVDLINEYDLTVDDAVGHYELDSKKTCPNLYMPQIRETYLGNF